MSVEKQTDKKFVGFRSPPGPFLWNNLGGHHLLSPPKGGYGNLGNVSGVQPRGAADSSVSSPADAAHGVNNTNNPEIAQPELD